MTSFPLIYRNQSVTHHIKLEHVKQISIFNWVKLDFVAGFFFPDGQNVHHRNKVMSWSTDAQPLLHEMAYKAGRLVIQKEGYYYVYSKVFFKDSEMFYHMVKYETPRYPGGNITLLESRKYSPKTGKTVRSNSYLGGVFHFNADDGIFVEVSNVAHIVRLQANENFFGAYMI